MSASTPIRHPPGRWLKVQPGVFRAEPWSILWGKKFPMAHHFDVGRARSLAAPRAHIFTLRCARARDDDEEEDDDSSDDGATNDRTSERRSLDALGDRAHARRAVGRGAERAREIVALKAHGHRALLHRDRRLPERVLLLVDRPVRLEARLLAVE